MRKRGPELVFAHQLHQRVGIDLVKRFCTPAARVAGKELEYVGPYGEGILAHRLEACGTRKMATYKHISNNKKSPRMAGNVKD